MFPEENKEDKKEESPEVEETSGDVLSMSDDEISDMSLDDFIKNQAKQDTSEENEEKDSPEEEEDIPARDVYEETGDSEEEDVEEEEEPEEDEDVEEDTEVTLEKKETGPGIDYENEYKKLLEPFKAADRTIQVNNVDEARRLMQMGVDYSRKMQSLKPHLKITKALENQKLLDVDKINHLIEISQGKKEAIVELLKKHNLDPTDLDLEDEKEYSPKSYTPSDKQQELEEVLDSIKGTASYQKTLEELGNKWDEESRAILMENPQVIAKINDHIEKGIYDMIMAEVERERALGTINGPDIAAYKTIGEKLQANGRFAHLASIKPKSESKPQKDSKEVKQRKRAAAPPKRTTKKSETLYKSPLSMSDEEFEREFGKVG